jgi:hypothetical protein
MAFSLETEEKCGIILVMSKELKQSSNPCLIYWLQPNWRSFLKENFCSWIMSSQRIPLDIRFVDTLIPWTREFFD